MCHHAINPGTGGQMKNILRITQRPILSYFVIRPLLTPKDCFTFFFFFGITLPLRWHLVSSGLLLPFLNNISVLLIFLWSIMLISCGTYEFLNHSNLILFNSNLYLSCQLIFVPDYFAIILFFFRAGYLCLRRSQQKRCS